MSRKANLICSQLLGCTRIFSGEQRSRLKTVPALLALAMVTFYGLIHSGVDTNSSFTVLRPRDNSANSQGKFPCGNIANVYETKEIVFPADLSCELCTLQLTWESPQFTHYSCADVTLMSDQVKLCMGKCKNSGTCVNGRCVCQDTYFGTFCESKGMNLSFIHIEKHHITIGYMWIVYLILIMLIAGLLYSSYIIHKRIKDGQAERSLAQEDFDVGEHIDLGDGDTPEVKEEDKKPTPTPEDKEELIPNPWKSEYLGVVPDAAPGPEKKDDPREKLTEEKKE